MQYKINTLTKSFLAILCILLPLAFQTARAEIWIEGGIELAVGGDNQRETNSDFFAAGYRFNYVDDNDSLYSLGLRYGDELLFSNTDEDEFIEISGALGRHIAYRYGATTLQAGLGVRSYRNGSNNEFFIPLRASLILGKYVGWSQSISLNISQDDPTIGFEFAYVFGKFN